MKEIPYHSTRELFLEAAPDLLEFLTVQDSFWSKINDNSITDYELDRHQALLEELGIYNADSAVAKAIQLVKDARQHSLPTPINHTF